MSKANEILSTANEILSTANVFLSTATNRITPNIILSVTMINGFILGFLTTGYLGEDSMGIFSFPFWLFVEQFVVICFFSSRYVNLTTMFLNKFAMVATFGFALQWQLFGIYVLEYKPKIKTIEPPVDNAFISALLLWGGVMLLVHCFSGNEVKKNNKINMSVE